MTGSRRCLTQPREFQKRHHLWRVLKDSKKRPVGWKCIQGVGPQYARTWRWETECSICREQSMSVGQVEGEMWGPALRRLCPRWLQVKTSVFKKSPEDQLWEFRLISQFVKLEYYRRCWLRSLWALKQFNSHQIATSLEAKCVFCSSASPGPPQRGPGLCPRSNFSAIWMF